MACGTPVIVSENTGAADCIEHGHSGYITPIRDVMTIRQHLVELFEDPSRVECMGAAAAAAARTFTWERYGAASIAAYEPRVTAKVAG
jgi:glycosyltransferase involved in cell wall biosynthesis